MEEKRMFRVDRWLSAGDFVCKICKAMQESELVVAGLTNRNANVYFEPGLAIGMGKPVILLRDCGDGEKGECSDLLALEYEEYDGREPEDAARVRRFGVVFDGVRKGGGKRNPVSNGALTVGGGCGRVEEMELKETGR